MKAAVPLLSNRCTAGVTPCGKSPARPYPCGPRCDDCKPANRKEAAK